MGWLKDSEPSLKKVRCLLFDAILRERIWAKIAIYSIDTLNRSSHSSLRFLTLKKKWSKHPPKLGGLKAFRCVVYVHQNQGKLKARATKCMFIGFTKGVKDFKIWHTIEMFIQGRGKPDEDPKAI